MDVAVFEVLKTKLNFSKKKKKKKKKTEKSIFTA